MEAIATTGGEVAAAPGAARSIRQIFSSMKSAIHEPRRLPGRGCDSAGRIPSCPVRKPRRRVPASTSILQSLPRADARISSPPGSGGIVGIEGGRRAPLRLAGGAHSIAELETEKLSDAIRNGPAEDGTRPWESAGLRRRARRGRSRQPALLAGLDVKRRRVPSGSSSPASPDDEAARVRTPRQARLRRPRHFANADLREAALRSTERRNEKSSKRFRDIGPPNCRAERQSSGSSGDHRGSRHSPDPWSAGAAIPTRSAARRCLVVLLQVRSR